MFLLFGRLPPCFPLPSRLWRCTSTQPVWFGFCFSQEGVKTREAGIIRYRSAARMPPRKVAQKGVADQNGHGEIAEGRPQRVRKPVDYREDDNSELKGSTKKVEKGQEKNIKKKGRSKKLDNATTAVAENESEEIAKDQEDNAVIGSSKKPRMTYVIDENNPGESLNETFVVKASTSGKGKRALVTVAESEDQEAKTTSSTGKSKKLNETNTDYSIIDFSSTLRTHCKNGEEWNLKISSWNVDGLRAWLKKDGVMFLDNEKPDILCLQETKCAENKIPPEAKFKGYHSYWSAGEKEGYSGVALLTKEEPISVEYGMGVEEHDSEGRLITAEFEKFYLVTTYVPNAGRKLVTLPKRLSWDAAFRKYLKKLDSKKPVILCGDMNVAHEEIDIANPKANTKNAGFTKEERDGMTELLAQGFIDTFRHFCPKKTGAYTFWTYLKAARSRNVGWRLDYFIVSEKIIDQVCDSVIRNQVLGSDHCPITLLFHQK